FFFQAEDGIRDRTVTGVQTCALPISKDALRSRCWPNDLSQKDQVAPLEARVSSALSKSRAAVGEVGRPWLMGFSNGGYGVAMLRSEERRVGKEGGAGWGRWQGRKKVE